MRASDLIADYRSRWAEMSTERRGELSQYRTQSSRVELRRARTLMGRVSMREGVVLDGSDQPDTTPTPLLESLFSQLSEFPSGRGAAVWGYGSIFDVGYLYRDEWGPYIERMATTAFDASKAIPNVQTAFMSSHRGLGMATTRAGRMAWGTDKLGLGFAASLNLEEPDSRSVRDKLESGSTPTDTSVGGSILDASWNDDYTELTITQWSLSRGEISIVQAGANPGGWVTLATPPVVVNEAALAAIDEIQIPQEV